MRVLHPHIGARLDCRSSSPRRNETIFCLIENPRKHPSMQAATFHGIRNDTWGLQARKCLRVDSIISSRSCTCPLRSSWRAHRTTMSHRADGLQSMRSRDGSNTGTLNLLHKCCKRANLPRIPLRMERSLWPSEEHDLHVLERRSERDCARRTFSAHSRTSGCTFSLAHTAAALGTAHRSRAAEPPSACCLDSGGGDLSLHIEIRRSSMPMFSPLWYRVRKHAKAADGSLPDVLARVGPSADEQESHRPTSEVSCAPFSPFLLLPRPSQPRLLSRVSSNKSADCLAPSFPYLVCSSHLPFPLSSASPPWA
eukprot:scaffold292963_cov35-Tisochrysis_lutea.AAC.1